MGIYITKDQAKEPTKPFSYSLLISAISTVQQLEE